MTGVVSEFFTLLGQRLHEPLLAKTSGTVRIDLDERGRTQHWFLTIDKGAIAVSRHGGPADCVLRSDKALFEGILNGQANAMAAFLRGGIVIDGDFALVVVLERLFPGGHPTLATHVRKGQ
jgi:putative sterol carrier protein